MRRASCALLRRASASGAACDFSAAAAPGSVAAAAAPLERFRERLASGPDFDAFVSGKDLANKDGYSVAAPPLKAGGAAGAAGAAARAHPPDRRRASPSRTG
jgi:hypothetical protein